jgi:hypothetical protein
VIVAATAAILSRTGAFTRHDLCKSPYITSSCELSCAASQLTHSWAHDGQGRPTSRTRPSTTATIGGRPTHVYQPAVTPGINDPKFEYSLVDGHAAAAVKQMLDHGPRGGAGHRHSVAQRTGGRP